MEGMSLNESTGYSSTVTEGRAEYMDTDTDKPVDVIVAAGNIFLLLLA